MKLKTIFTAMMSVVLLSCSFLTLSAQNDCDSLTWNGPFVRYKAKKPLPFTTEEEKEAYKEYSPVIVPEYFLLGVLPEVRLGLRFNTSYPLATYQHFEKHKVDFLETYIREHFKIQISIKKDSVQIYIYSRELAVILDKFLTQYGELNLRMLDSEQKLYSYLSGAYYKSGFRMSENIYCVYWHNERNVYEFLKDARCRKILFLTVPVDPNILNYILDTHLFCFEPSVYLRKYLDSYQKEALYKERITDKERPENERLMKGEKKIKMLEEIFDSWQELLE